MSEREPAELLMLTSEARPCPDCGDDRVFVAVDPENSFEYACTDCGAAVMLDLAIDLHVAPYERRRVS